MLLNDRVTRVVPLSLPATLYPRPLYERSAGTTPFPVVLP
jgi:hypothetical protein